MSSLQDVKIEELQFPTPWGYISAKAWGEKTSIPVLAIHGFNDNAATFDHLIPLLPQGFYFVCIDLPSHGKSSFYPQGVTLDFLSCLREIRRILSYLNWKKYLILSHSAGGHFCLFLASLYPEVILKIIILDLFPFFLVIDKKEICDRLRYIFEYSFILDKKNLLPKRKYKTHKQILEKYHEKHFSDLSRKSACTLLNRIIQVEDNENVIYVDNRKDLLLLPVMTLDFHLSVIKNIKSKVLIIIPSESKVIINEVPSNRASIDEIKKSLGSLVTIQFVNGNHNVHLDNPERVAPIISSFITSDTCSL